jgi:hypothetical protein
MPLADASGILVIWRKGKNQWPGRENRGEREGRVCEGEGAQVEDDVPAQATTISIG